MKKILVLFLLLGLIFPQVAFAKKQKTTIPEGSGYVGTLPDVTKRFQKTEMVESPEVDSTDAFDAQDTIKPAPRNNPAFVNIIMKTDKTSQYLNDLNNIISLVEKLQNTIENNNNVQQFNAESYDLKVNVDYFRNKYKNKAEQSYVSFKEVMQLNTQVQSVARLRLEKEVYSPYVTATQSGNMFSNNTIDTQLNYLLDNIKSTLVVLKQTR